MDNLKVDIKKLNRIKGMDLKLYLDLLCLFGKKVDKLYYATYINCHGGDVSLDSAKRLEELKYIKIIDINSPTGYELRANAYTLIEGEKNYFYTFLKVFPIKTPSGRYLSPKGADTVAGSKLNTKWKNTFGSDVANQQRAIDILEAEIAWRVKTGKMEFMHNAETWLNQGDWEKYEHLLTEKLKVENKTREDFL